MSAQTNRPPKPQPAASQRQGFRGHPLPVQLALLPPATGAAQSPPWAPRPGGQDHRQPPRRHGSSRPLCWLGGIVLALGLTLGLLLPAAPAQALNDAQQLVVEAWRLVNQSYVDPQQLEAVHWRRLRQQALEKPIQQSGQAYDAIEAMLQPLADPYTRLLRPAEFASLRSNTRGTVTGVGLQLGLRDGGERIVVISPLDDSPAAAAGVASGWEVLAVNGQPTSELGLEGTAAALRGDRKSTRLNSSHSSVSRMPSSA